MSCVSSKEKQKITKIHKKEDLIVFKKRNSNNGNLDCQSAWGSLKLSLLVSFVVGKDQKSLPPPSLLF